MKNTNEGLLPLTHPLTNIHLKSSNAKLNAQIKYILCTVPTHRKLIKNSFQHDQYHSFFSNFDDCKSDQLRLAMTFRPS